MKIFKSTKINKFVCQSFVIFIFIILAASAGNCFAMLVEQKDNIDNLSFSHDGKKVIFDRCREGCQIQMYDLETGDLVAYQSPKGERWTMARQSYDGKKIVFSVMPVVDGHVDLSEMQIAVMDADGKNYKKITTGQGAKLYPTFSHSGNKILYARAAYMRKSGKTPAAQYDAWEVDLTTGTQTQLTFFKYFYMGNLTYFPDDEQFVYYGELPEAFPGLDLPKGEPRKAQEMIRQEQMKRKIGIAGILVMKRGKDLPQRHYNFGKGFNAERPLLSKDGSMLIVEKSASAGEFYLYAPDGNHRLVGSGGSVDAAAISPNGGLLAIISVNTTINIFNAKDGKRKIKLYLSIAEKMENWENVKRQRESMYGEKYTMIPDKPSRILNR